MEDNRPAGYVSLERPVYTFLDETDRGEESYRKAYKLGIDAYRELSLDVCGRITPALITVLANKTGKLPNDYSNWIRVGIPNQYGELATFTENNSLTIYNTEDVNKLANEDTGEYRGAGSIFEDRPRDVRFTLPYTASLGVGSNNNIGEFKIDKRAGYIIFDPSFSYGSVVMEYMADLNCDNEEYWIDVAVERAIVDFIHWKWNAKKKDISGSQKRDERFEYYNQKRLARARMNPLRLQSMNDSYRVGVKAAPKA